MNAVLKSILIPSAKNAVNAILTNSALMAMLPHVFSVHTPDGWWNIGKLTLTVVAAREAMVWVPEILKWSTSPN